jgi:RecA-family ATPase
MKKLDEIENLTKSIPSFKAITELDIHVEWIVDTAIPKKCVILFVGRRGIGKTWFMIRMIESIIQGKDFLGMATTPIPTFYIDFENPLPVIHDRLEIVLQSWDMSEDLAFFWHRYHDPVPPRIDSVDWKCYTRFLKEHKECLIVFDTLRSSQTQNLNDDQVAAKLMERLKHLSDLGATIILLHHTPKYDTTTFKASGTIPDLADHTLIMKDTNTNLVRSFGTLDKTRYGDFETFYRHNGNFSFQLEQDPFLREVDPIVQIIRENPNCNQKFIKEHFPRKYSSDSTWNAKLRKAEEIGLFKSERIKKERRYWIE